MVKEVPELPSADREHMWLKLDELLQWKPQSDVAKPYPAKGAASVGPASSARGSSAQSARAPQAARRRPHGDQGEGGCRMIENLLQNLDALLLVIFGVSALVAAALMIVLRHPMQVAMALISTMVFLGGIYGLVGVHFIAAFQVLIYVSAVMVFMVYVIMLLDVRDPSFTRRFSTLLVPGHRRRPAAARGARVRAVARPLRAGAGRRRRSACSSSRSPS